MSRTILGPALVISCTLAMMPLLVQPTPVERHLVEYAATDAAPRVEALRAAQVPAGYSALASVR